MMEGLKLRYHYGQCLFYTVVLVIAAHLMVDSVAGGTAWWSLGITGCALSPRARERTNESCPNCASLSSQNYITKEQAEECSSRPSVIPGISRGARHAIIDCQRRFNTSRWNCSTLHGEYLFGKFVVNGFTKETAILTSYFIAGSIWGIATDCHDQKIPDCPCNGTGERSIDEAGNIIFRSCDANYAYARNYLDSFVLNSIDDKTLQGALAINNSNIGKKVVEDRTRACRCHGISGTCTVQTCYAKVKSVEEIGDLLFQKYQSAKKIETLQETYGDDVQDSMLFTNTSPNFCVHHNELGTVGIENRVCNLDSNSRGACAVLCCNYGSRRVTRIVPVRECEFVWCCRLECRIVRNETIHEYLCNGPPPNGAAGLSS